MDSGQGWELEEDCVIDWASMDTGRGRFRLNRYYKYHQRSYSVFGCLSAHDTTRFLTLTRTHLMRHLDLPMAEDFFVFKKTTSVKQTPFKTHWRRFGFFGSSCNSKLKGNGKDELANTASILSLTRETAKTLNALMTVLGQEKHLCRENLFSKSSPSVRKLKPLYKLFNNQTGLDLTSNKTLYDTYDFANVLMNTLEDLNDPLFTQDLFNVFCEIADRKDAKRKVRIECIRLALLLLPKENRNLLRRLLHLLRRVSLESNLNKMNARNLATIFAKCLLCPRTMNVVDWELKKDGLVQILTFMIEYATELFLLPIALLTDLKLLLKERKNGKVPPLNKEQKEEQLRTALSCEQKCHEKVRRVDTNAETLSDSKCVKVKKENRKVIKPTNGKPKRSFKKILKKWFCFNNYESDGCHRSYTFDYGFDASN